MSKIHIGPHTHQHAAETEETYDREIDLRGIFWTALALVVTIVASCVLMWGMLKGFNRLDDRRDLPPPALPEARRQAAPPEPRLETSSQENLRVLRAEEDNVLGHSAWIDRGQGSVRVPIDVAMEVVARQGWGPGGGAGYAAPTTPAGALGAGSGQTGQVGQTADPQAPQGGALVQMSRQPAQNTAAPSATQPGREETPQPRRPPAPPERR